MTLPITPSRAGLAARADLHRRRRHDAAWRRAAPCGCARHCRDDDDRERAGARTTAGTYREIRERFLCATREMTLHPEAMRRSHVLLAGGVVLAGAAALACSVGAGRGAATTAEIGAIRHRRRGAPATSRRSPTTRRSPRQPRQPPAACVAELLDLDHDRASSAITTRRRSPTAAARSSRSIPTLQAAAEKLLDRSARAARRDRRDGARRPDPRARRPPHRRAARAATTARSTGTSRPTCGRRPRRCSSSSPRARWSPPASIPTTRSASTAAFARSRVEPAATTSATRAARA